MIRWDETYELFTLNPEKAAAIKQTATEGLRAYGLGAVLVHAKVKLHPRTQPQGFGSKKQPPSADSADADLKIEEVSYVYLPLALMQSGECSAAEESTVRVATTDELLKLLNSGGVDPSRLLRLCGHVSDSVEQYPESDAPYAPEAGELVLMLDMELDGEHAYGADVAFPKGNVLLTKGLDDVEELYSRKGY